MDRRSFFRSALDKGSKPVVKAIDASIKKQASRWIRPPFAINELEFVLACTRCSDCIEACPHQVIFSLPVKVGMKFVGTPALDLLNKGCHLCEDWPCVNACKANALVLPDTTQDSPDSKKSDASISTDHNAVNNRPLLPKLANVTINEQTCLPYNGPECGACFSSCPVAGALTVDMFRPVIDQALCSGCGLCRENCIVNPEAILISSVQVS